MGGSFNATPFWGKIHGFFEVIFKQSDLFILKRWVGQPLERVT